MKIVPLNPKPAELRPIYERIGQYRVLNPVAMTAQQRRASWDKLRLAKVARDLKAGRLTRKEAKARGLSPDRSTYARYVGGHPIPRNVEKLCQAIDKLAAVDAGCNTP